MERTIYPCGHFDGRSQRTYGAGGCAGLGTAAERVKVALCHPVFVGCGRYSASGANARYDLESEVRRLWSAPDQPLQVFRVAGALHGDFRDRAARWKTKRSSGTPSEVAPRFSSSALLRWWFQELSDDPAFLRWQLWQAQPAPKSHASRLRFDRAARRRPGSPCAPRACWKRARYCVKLACRRNLVFSPIALVRNLVAMGLNRDEADRSSASASLQLSCAGLAPP